MTQREEAKKYWFSKLKGLENSVQMDEMGKKFRSYNKGTIRKSLNRDMTGKLMTLCKSDSWLLFTFLLAAVKIVIYKFTGESDITVCSPIFYDGENKSDRNIFILFRDCIPPGISFRKWLLQVKQTVSLVKKYQAFPLSTVFDLLDIQFKAENTMHLLVEGAHYSDLHQSSGQAALSLKGSLGINQDDQIIHLEFNYNACCFSPQYIASFGECLINVLEQVLDRIDIPVSDIKMVKTVNANQLMLEMKSFEQSYAKKSIPELFQQICEASPDATALSESVRVEDLIDQINDYGIAYPYQNLLDRLFLMRKNIEISFVECASDELKEAKSKKWFVLPAEGGTHQIYMNTVVKSVFELFDSSHSVYDILKKSHTMKGRMELYLKMTASGSFQCLLANTMNRTTLYKLIRVLFELRELSVQPFSLTDEWGLTALQINTFSQKDLNGNEDSAKQDGYLIHSITYGQLNRLSDGLAAHLKKEGVGAETIVGILLPRSSAAIVSVLAVLKAGGAYLPLDTNMPDEQLEFILHDSGAEILITNPEFLKKTTGKVKTVVNVVEQGIYREKLCDWIPPSLDSLAYVIYTSGSTGTPKGVMLTHRGVANLQLFFRQELEITKEDTVALFASLAFDASVSEIFMALLCGAGLSILLENEIFNISAFTDAINRNRITVLTLPPHYLQQLEPERFPTLRRLISAGSQISTDVFNRWNRSVQMMNAYGPTETTVCATAFQGKLGETYDSIPIGSPIPNTQLLIMDLDGGLLPPGTPGELCISGVGLARGYLNNPQLTLEKFIPNPYGDGRLYHTGDIAVQGPGGEFIYIGRKDRQMKIRGYRIEPEEIEHCLNKHPSVIQSAVAERKDKKEADGIFCAFIESTGELYKKDLRNYLRNHLPEYKIPDLFIRVDKLPRNRNGKVDYSLLPNLESVEVMKDPYIPPRNETEDVLEKIWNSLLHKTGIGIRANFFEIGGNSLLCIQMVAQIEKRLGYKIRVTDVYTYPSILEMAQFIREGEVKTGS